MNNTKSSKDLTVDFPQFSGIKIKKNTRDNNLLEPGGKKGIAYYAIKVLEKRYQLGENKKIANLDIRTDAIKTLKEISQKKRHILFSKTIGCNATDSDFTQLANQAYLEAEKFVNDNIHNIEIDNLNEESVCDQFINIKLPNSIPSFSAEFYAGIIVTLIFYIIASRKSENDRDKDKQIHDNNHDKLILELAEVKNELQEIKELFKS